MTSPQNPSGPFDRSGLHAVNRLMTSTLRRPAELSLDGVWQFQLLPSDTAPSTGAWQDVVVPSLWTMSSEEDRPQYTNVPMPFEEVYPTVPAHNPVGVYRREFEFTPGSGRRPILHVGAAEGYLRVTVNGIPVGTSGDSHLAAEFDLNGVLVEGTNLLELSVSKWSSASYLEDQDQWWQSGISRPVYLYSITDISLADVSVVADFDPESRLGSLSVVAATSGLKHQPAVEHSIRIRVLGETRSTGIAARTPTKTMPPPERDRSERPPQRFPEDFMDMLSLTAADAPPPPEFIAPASAVGDTTPQTAQADPGCARVDLTQLHVKPWSAESPELEDLVVELLNPDGDVVDSTALRIGFRRVRVEGRNLLVNGEPILIQGVNRHDVDPVTGRVMTRERFMSELALLKRFNVNAIRTSHYPNDPVFLDLCDEYGFYVVDEADIEGHAFADTIADDPLYLPEIVERVSRMVLRDRNHPSVIVWSLGNETGYGSAHDAAAAWTRRFDPTRPVQYEGAVSANWHGGHAATDIVCPMYPAFSSISAYASHPQADRPLIFSEYAYSQGNSTGGLDEYWRLFESLPGVQGGFLWEFLDHALDPDRSGRMLYGGDFGDPANNGQTVLNGIAASDLTPRPAMFELRGIFSPICVVSDAQAAHAGRLRIRNRQSFETLDRFVLELHVSSRYGNSAATTVGTPEVAAGSEATIAIPEEIVRALQDASALALNITVRTRTAAVWAQAGSEVAVHQVVVRSASEPIRSGDSGAAEVDEDGRIAHPLLARAPQLALWRALTDNELSFALDQRFVRSGFFRLDLDGPPHVGQHATTTEIVTRYRTAFGDPVIHRRTVSRLGEEDYLFDEEVTLPAGTRDGLRVGMRFELVPGFQTAEWVGLGPWENYPDRQASALVGRWTSEIDELAVPYVRPQENGSRSGVTRLEILGEHGRVTMLSEIPLHMNVSRHSPEQLEAVDHWWKLPPSPATVVHIDVAQRGVGTGRIGPDTRPVYRLSGDRYVWSWRLRFDEHHEF
ncbi:glycoside hydrolase family 2 TIM barrel-domain containing protein [Leifsonia sp. SIMBA_070]|uniref:glycoside hydrolase family 2 TIM barrel-domain containing protein n=2 Tax=Bacillati TaxID=1783272 RepID=UPI00397DAB28